MRRLESGRGPRPSGLGYLEESRQALQQVECDLARFYLLSSAVHVAPAFYTGWMYQPGVMRTTEWVAVVAVFSSLIVGSDFALTPLVNIKLMDTLVFVAAFVFGFRTGAAVAVISETIWSVVSPWGAAGAIMPFLVAGELLFAFAGYAAAKAWGSANLHGLSLENSFLGASLAICAFFWDFGTNIATGLLAGATSLPVLMSYVIAGVPFMIPHELSDFALGSVLAPAAILYSSRMAGRRGSFGPLGTRSPMPRAESGAS